MRKAVYSFLVLVMALSCGKEIVTEEIIKEVLVEAEAKLSVECSTGSASELTPTSASLSGVAAIVNAKDAKAAVSFYYSSEVPSGADALKNGTKADAGFIDKSGGSFELTIGNLTPETTYYYMAAVSVDGQEFIGKVESFVTGATPRDIVTTGSATEVSVWGATLSGFANLPAGIDNAVLGIVCSKDNDNFDGGVLFASGEVDSNKEFRVTASGLASDTEYYYQAFVRYSDTEGTVSRYGVIRSFKTNAVDAAVQTLEAKDVEEHSATLQATLTLYANENLPVTGTFFIGKGALSKESLLSGGIAYPARLSSDGVAECDVKELESGEDYSFVVEFRVYDKTFSGEVRSLTMADHTTVKTVGAKRIQHSIATVSGLLYVDGNKPVSKSAGFLYSSSYASAEGLIANGKKAVAILDGEAFVGQLMELEYGKTYYYLACAEVNGRTVYADEVMELTPSAVPEGAVYLGTVCKGADGLLYDLFWGTCNLGAEKPEDYGDYYAWGEVETKDNYSWSTYKWGNSSTNLTKYNTDRTRGSVDNKTVLESEDDAAHVKLGGSWRMPTDVEWKELRTECTWTWTTQNGVNGLLVTGPNGNSIFLPAASLRESTSLCGVGSYGYYWSSSLNTGYPIDALGVNFYFSDVYRSYYDRYYGLTVRPVTE